MAVAAPKLKSASQTAPPPSRTAPPDPKKRPRDRPAAGKPRKVDLNSPAPRKAKAAPRRKASPGVRAAAAKAAPARKPARRKVAPKRRPASVIPIAAGHVGRAAVGVTQLPESGLIHRLTRGRLWIGLLGVLLVGIVALNVVTLSFAASSGKIDAKNTLLGKENSVMQGRWATVSGQGRMRNEAKKLGLAPPTEAVPKLIEAKPTDVREAAARLAAAAPSAAIGATSEGEGASEEGASGEEVGASAAGASGEEAAVSEESGEDLSQYSPEEIEIFEQEYAELLASEGVTETPAG
jgi:hypothetical protein